ncbi:MAG: exosortase T [Rhizobiaceae bacterium]|nr:exosortase T [Rhizobiaceae bacterium]
MMQITVPHISSRHFLRASFALASAILAIEPLRWLITTWLDPSYQSSGAIYACLIIALVGYSVSSPLRRNHKSQSNHAFALLLFSALVRLAGQLLAINILGGVALALDIYALLTLLNMANRRRPISPFWVSVLFLFALPFERVVQRVLGYPMQELSAFGACNLLSPFFNDLICEGVRIQVEGRDVLVDLPCSGTASLMLCLAFVVCLNALYRPKFMVAALWGIVALVLAIIGNMLRISFIAVGLLYEPVLGFDVMAQPFHDLLGYGAIALSLLPVLLGHRASSTCSSEKVAAVSSKWFPIIRLPATPLPATPLPATRLPATRSPECLQVFAAVGLLSLALIIVNLPRQALDVSRPLAEIQMPLALEGHVGRPQGLTAMESAYFEQYGGQARKALYGKMALTLVQTSSPLRHLHAPDDCLRGLGYRVEFLGTRFSPVPTALYRATGQQGDSWHVAATFTSDRGDATSSVAEAIWQWIAHPKTRWSSVQRITPWQMNGWERDALENATVAALDMAVPPLATAFNNPQQKIETQKE